MGAIERQCGVSALSLVFQFLFALVIIVVAFYGAYLVLETLNLIGLSTVPPGLRFGDQADGCTDTAVGKASGRCN